MSTDCMYSGNHQYVSLADTGYFTSLVTDYLSGDSKLSAFYEFEPNEVGIEKAINRRKNFPIDRKVLVDVLRSQYEKYDHHKLVDANIESLLSENTFTVTSAHQPNIFTGYAYFIYKIMHSVVLSDELSKAYPNLHFVPCFYIGSEDDDIDELGKFRFNDFSFKWESVQQGAVGMMNPAELGPILDELFKVLGPTNDVTARLKDLFSNAYLKHETIAAATQFIVHELFKDFGVIALDPNVATLKKVFSPIIKSELIQPKSKELVNEQSAILNQHYKAQAYARDINLFYLKEGLRKRIEQQDEHTWIVVDTDIKWSKSELIDELEMHPERFSPNVILRGLYQESILPNVAFIGGGSEVAYWLQLKTLFAHYNVFYPCIVLRQSVQFVTKNQMAKIDQLNWKIKDVFQPLSLYKDLYTKQHSTTELALQKEMEIISEALNSIKAKAVAVDSNLAYSSEAVRTKINKQVAILEHKMLKAEKKKHDVYFKRIDNLKNELFPNNTLQERYFTFMQEYIFLGSDYFKMLRKFTKPFGDEFLVIY